MATTDPSDPKSFLQRLPAKQYIFLAAILALSAAIFWAAWTWNEPKWAWVFTLVLLVAFILLVGALVTGRLLGVLIDERNKVSLSRLQATIWTVIILSAFIVIAVENIDRGKDEPLAVEIPQELLIVMGISAASLVASPLVKSTKLSEKADLDEANKTLRDLHVIKKDEETASNDNNLVLKDNNLVLKDTTDVIAKGQIAVNPSIKGASMLDLMSGEETSNAAKLDLGKIQMLFFTLILALAYGAALSEMLGGDEPFDEFPVFDESMIALLGISHAAYLANKAVPRTKAP